MADHPFPWTDACLAALREWPVLAHGAKAAGVNRSTVWRRIQDDKEFASLVEDAMDEGIDRAEQEAFRRGVVGFEEPVVYQGRLCFTHALDADGKPMFDEKDQPIAVPLTVRKHSDALLSLVLKGRRKKVYAERTELTGADGKDLDSGMDDVTRAARVAQILAMAKRRADGAPEPEDLA